MNYLVWMGFGLQENVKWFFLESYVVVFEVMVWLKDQLGVLLLILYGVQEVFGYVFEGVVLFIVCEFNLLCVDVYGVVSFYYFFCIWLLGKCIVYLCCVELCQLMGVVVLEMYVKQWLGIDFYEIMDDGVIMFELVYCLGNCVCLLVMLVDEELYGCVMLECFDVWLKIVWEVL